MMKRAFLATALAGSLLLAACGKDEGTGPVLASVNGHDIYTSQVENQLQGVPADLMAMRGDEIRRQLLDRVIEQELLLQAAKSEKIEKDAEFQKQLAEITKQLKMQAVVAKKVSETLTEAKLREVYEATKETRAFPAVKARHILVPNKAEADALIAIANPANFAELARTRSTGPNKENGGELGWFRREAMIPAFAELAFNTPVGTVARTPVETQFGWHVILVEDRNQAHVPPFEQVAESIRQEMTQATVQGYLADLRKAATITYADVPAPATEASPTAAQ